MIKIRDIEMCMRPNFIYDKKGKKMQTLEEYDRTKEIARAIFVGLCDMYGYNGTQVMQFLDIGYDEYRSKLRHFRLSYRTARESISKDAFSDQPLDIKRMYYKIILCLNALKYYTFTDTYQTINTYTNEHID